MSQTIDPLTCPPLSCAYRGQINEQALDNSEKQCKYCQAKTSDRPYTLCDTCASKRQSCARCDTPISDGDFYVNRATALVDELIQAREACQEKLAVLSDAEKREIEEFYAQTTEGLDKLRATFGGLSKEEVFALLVKAQLKQMSQVLGATAQAAPFGIASLEKVTEEDKF